VTAPFVIDASGPRGFLHGALNLGEQTRRWLPPTEGLYTHFTNVERWDRLHDTDEAPPYPIDDAALHQVCPGGWIWILRFNNGITSAGAALTDRLAASIRASEGEPPGGGCSRRCRRWPISSATREPCCRSSTRRESRSAARAWQGTNWALLPSAAGVIDPLLSTGFPLTLLGILRLVDVLERTLDAGDRAPALAEYERVTLAELDITEQLVAALYATMDAPAMFKRLSLLYFAAASYSETARRLGRPDLAPGFLLSAHPTFGPEMAACAALAAEARSDSAQRALEARIDHAIAPFDAGRPAGSRPARLVPGPRGRSARGGRPVQHDARRHRRAAALPVCRPALVQFEDCPGSVTLVASAGCVSPD
jgi:FADH2 O2-dependent halogenase